MDADRIVRDFCAAWGRADLDAIMGAFAEDAVYHNIPLEPCVGKGAIKGFIEGFLSTSPGGIDFDIRHQVVKGNVVMNERVDTFEMEGRRTPIPVCGVFELDDEGRIVAWRDYFDMGAMQAGA
ncbi:MAG: nuclear transport factor 2 family protein [Spirochaetaceae bacterium]|nr:nuclear transport factor 2 family protein [Spirochaetaceae bacterium]